MNLINWLHAWNEFLKCFLVAWGVLGYPVNKKCTIRNVLLLVIGSLGIFVLGHFDRTIYSYILMGIFYFLFLEASLKDKIKLYLISKVTVAIMDLFLWSVLYAILPIVKELDFMEFNFGLDVFWIVITIALYRYRKKINEYFITLSVGWIVFFFALLLGMGLMAGCIQYVLYEDSSSKLIQIALVIQNVLTLLIAGGCVAFSYHIISKRNVQLLLEQEQEKYLIQSKMYSSKVKQNEDIRKFRHDMEKHMKIIRQLCDDIPNPDSKVEKLTEYIDEYLEKSPKQIIVQTGHIVSDYFISELILEVGKNPDFNYSIMGKLPEDILISDADLSILLGNALDNAKRELLKIEGPCYFEISFRNYNGKIMISIKNTKAPFVAEEVQEEGHGYGIKNMKELVDRHYGNLRITETDDTFCVDILI